jgi:hypothetical protein
MVALLALAHDRGCEAELAAALTEQMARVEPATQPIPVMIGMTALHLFEHRDRPQGRPDPGALAAPRGGRAAHCRA